MKQKKIDIIRAAERRFNKFGLKKTSLEEIARDLRMGKATLYHYFISKEELYFEVLAHQKKEMLAEIESLFNNETIAPSEKLEQYLHSKLNIREKYPLIQVLLNLIITEEMPDETSKKVYKNLLLDEEKLIGLLLNSLAGESTIIGDKELAFFLVSGSYLLRSVVISKFGEENQSMNDGFNKKISKNFVEFVFNSIGFKESPKISDS